MLYMTYIKLLYKQLVCSQQETDSEEYLHTHLEISVVLTDHCLNMYQHIMSISLVVNGILIELKHKSLISLVNLGNEEKSERKILTMTYRSRA